MAYLNVLKSISVAFALLVCLFIIDARYANALTIPVVPVSGELEIYSDVVYSFDNNTGDFSAVGPIVAVQFANGVVSETDPLVLAQSEIRTTATFTGTSFKPIDTSGIFYNVKREIFIGGMTLYYDAIDSLIIDSVYTAGTSQFFRWVGGIMTSMFFDPSLVNSVNSPFLSDWIRADGVPDEIIVFNNGSVSILYSKPVSEPGALTLMIIPLIALLRISQVRRVR